MSVDTTDFRFATEGAANVFHRFGSAGDCLSMNCSVDHKKGNFKVDIRGTKFILPKTIPYLYTGFPECVRGVHMELMSSDSRQWSGYCGGFCAKCWPTKPFLLLVEGC